MQREATRGKPSIHGGRDENLQCKKDSKWCMSKMLKKVDEKETKELTK